MTIHDTFKKENINKTWSITIYADETGFIESDKKGIKADFKLGENGFYGCTLEGVPYSVQVKAKSLAKRLYNEMNRMYRFSLSRQRDGNFGLSQYAYVR